MTGNTLEQHRALALDLAPRAAELADRLVASGPKAAHVSASETHEISEFVHLAIAALRLSAGADWQPIETAPHDGSAFLGCSDHMFDTEGHPLMWACRFDGYMGYFRSNTDHEPLYDLTHWQPLPAAPRHEPGEG